MNHSSSNNNMNTGIESEQVLVLVFRYLNFDPHVLSVIACVSRRLRAVASRVLWRELCISRAPRMISTLIPPSTPISPNWNAIAKLLFFCCGHLPLQIPGHFVQVSRFSKTSGKSFLHRKCWGDLLYVSDPCEHSVLGGGEEEAEEEEVEDLGVYRGVFRGFMRSKTRAWLISKKVELERGVRCPYCGARVWSMAAARMVPRSASRRLGSHQGSLEYFVCVNGHLHGNCWLVHLSDNEDDEHDGIDPEEDDDDDEEEEEDDDDHIAF